ncbi:MAG: hypothetical protein ABIH42_06535 [Planctomycetota bacterium]
MNYKIFLFLILSLLSCSKSHEQPKQQQQEQSLYTRPVLAKDNQNRLYSIEISDKMGANDIYITYSEDGKNWHKPLFTGLSVSEDYAPDSSNISITKGTIELIYNKVTNYGKESKREKAIFSLNDIQRDTDEDGLVDIEEIRLRTDPMLTDTDSDGIKDSKDFNPLVAKKKLTTNQKIRAAAFRRVIQMSETGNNKVFPSSLVIVNTPYLEKQEFPGHDFYVLNLTEEELKDFKSQIGDGVCVINFAKESIISDKAEVEVQAFWLPLFARGWKVSLKKNAQEPEGWEVTNITLEWRPLIYLYCRKGTSASAQFHYTYQGT